MRQRHCDFEGCDQPHRSLGYCSGHYNQYRRTGRLRPLRLKAPGATESDLLKRLEIRLDTGCWEWQGTRTSDGYGVVTHEGQQVRVHRRMYELYYGPIPDGAVVHHVCANRSCARPHHLQAISQANNVAEMHERKTYLQRIAELEARLAACQCGGAS